MRVVGIDFLDNIKGLGIKKMYNILNKHRDVDTAFKALRSDAKTREIIPDGYEEKWRQARLIFKHALVYDIFDKSLRHLTPLGEDVASQYDDLSFLGPVFDDVEARRIAEGELNPISRQKFIQSPPAAAKTPTNGGKFQFGAKRKQGRAEAGTNAQRSLMMNFFTKLVPTSPLRKKPAPEPPCRVWTTKTTTIFYSPPSLARPTRSISRATPPHRERHPRSRERAHRKRPISSPTSFRRAESLAEDVRAVIRPPEPAHPRSTVAIHSNDRTTRIRLVIPRVARSKRRPSSPILSPFKVPLPPLASIPI